MYASCYFLNAEFSHLFVLRLGVSNQRNLVVIHALVLEFCKEPNPTYKVCTGIIVYLYDYPRGVLFTVAETRFKVFLLNKNLIC